MLSLAAKECYNKKEEFSKKRRGLNENKQTNKQTKLGESFCLVGFYEKKSSSNQQQIKGKVRIRARIWLGGGGGME